MENRKVPLHSENLRNFSDLEDYKSRFVELTE